MLRLISNIRDWVAILSLVASAGCGLGSGERTAEPVQWVALPGGCFTMGCQDPGVVGCEYAPQHKVCVDAFEITATEFTNGQVYRGFGEDQSDDMPAAVDHFFAKRICEELAARLPTEAEWEYAARGGTVGRTYCEGDLHCLVAHEWLRDNSEDGDRREVAILEPNPYGLYDMLGNANEWVSDRWSKSYYEHSPVDNPESGMGLLVVVRSIGMHYYADQADVGQREGRSSDAALGFRCVRPTDHE